MNQELKLKRKKWYNNNNVQFELLKLMKDREVCFMERQEGYTVRGLCITSIKWLNEIFKIFGFFEKDYNIYISVASYSHIPHFTLNLNKRNEETSAWFQNKARKSIIGYDFLHDFDSIIIENYMKMKKEIERLLEFYESETITYSIYPSGNNFQIIIPSNVINLKRISENRDDFESLNGYTYKYIKAIKERFGFEYLDLKGIGVFNKIRKLPYSLVGDKVCLPLTYDWFIKHFIYESVDSNSILKEYKLGFRGHKFLNGFGKDLNQRHFKDFTKQFFLD